MLSALQVRWLVKNVISRSLPSTSTQATTRRIKSGSAFRDPAFLNPTSSSEPILPPSSAGGLSGSRTISPPQFNGGRFCRALHRVALDHLELQILFRPCHPKRPAPLQS